MLEKATENLDKLSKGDEVTDACVASELISEAFPKERHGTVQAACWAAYRALKLKSERRAKAIWNGEARRIDAHEMEALRRAALARYIEERNRSMARIEALQRAVRNPGADLVSTYASAVGEQD